MAIFISLLRGINVSGQKKILMKELKELYEALNFSNVRTYIQSGNVVFESQNENEAEVAGQIRQEIQQKYGFDVPIIIRTVAELEYTRNNVYASIEEGINPDSIYFTFLAEKPTETNQAKINATHFLPDEYIIEGREIYVYCTNGYGNTKLSNTFFENKLKVSATTRNWKTLNVLIEMAKEEA